MNVELFRDRLPGDADRYGARLVKRFDVRWREAGSWITEKEASSGRVNTSVTIEQGESTELTFIRNIDYTCDNDVMTTKITVIMVTGG